MLYFGSLGSNTTTKTKFNIAQLTLVSMKTDFTKCTMTFL